MQTDNVMPIYSVTSVTMDDKSAVMLVSLVAVVIVLYAFFKQIDSILYQYREYDLSDDLIKRITQTAFGIMFGWAIVAMIASNWGVVVAIGVFVCSFCIFYGYRS